MNIYVSNLSFNVKEEDLKALFTEYGEVSSVKIITDHISGRSRGFAFVEMPSDDSARKAMEELNTKTVDGRQINISEARPKTNTKSGFNKSNNW